MFYCNGLCILCILFLVDCMHGFKSTKLKFRTIALFDSSKLLEEDEKFRNIATSYLKSKFQACDREGCRLMCDRSDAQAILKEILPPVSSEELEQEIDYIMGTVEAKGDISEEDFLAAVLGNNYWADAGQLVVKELILLDCLNAFFSRKVSLLADDLYDDLKESLTWEGSVVSVLKGTYISIAEYSVLYLIICSLTAKEVQFIFAVAAYRRGDKTISDSEYECLKRDLQGENSWVVKRGALFSLNLKYL